MIEAHTVPFNDVLKAGIQAGNRIRIQKLVGGGDGPYGDSSHPEAVPVIHAEASVRLHAIRQDFLPVILRKDELRAGAGPGPGPPGRMVYMIQVIMGAQEQIDPRHFLHGNRRSDLPPRQIGSKIINAENGFPHFDQQAHLTEPLKNGCALGHLFLHPNSSCPERRIRL